jgi:hypothetical protein
MSSMEIYPNKGIGGIEFGMNPAAVKEIMGSDSAYEEWMGGNLNDTLFYTDLIIGFNDCDEDEPLPNSQVVEFRANASDRIKFNGVALAELSRETLASMIVQEVKATLDKNQDVIFRDLGVSFGFNENGTVCILEMWQQNS